MATHEQHGGGPGDEQPGPALDGQRNRDFRTVMVLAVLTLGIGTVVFHQLEGWSWVDSVYFSAITLTTVGYGDLSPTTDAAKLFTVVYVLTGVGLIAAALNIRLSSRMSRRAARRQARRASEG